MRATPIPWLQPARRDECSPQGSDRADLGVAVTHPATPNTVEMARKLSEGFVVVDGGGGGREFDGRRPVSIRPRTGVVCLFN